ncbi:uncharacterized protein LOC122503784 isoform X2 [Leptopilina heterotoma]|uniref:uncharacterized protein LOC122503784 isoform X2 n=1 Tax=Leptopilina heterotoma TaxID=63436 RepID=UPI001CA821F2|nr:uncharacterized protein LOC122503784 isoform X2 [Leptopilina heterotoma]
MDEDGYKRYLREDTGTIPKSTQRSREKILVARAEHTRTLQANYQEISSNSSESEEESSNNGDFSHLEKNESYLHAMEEDINFPEQMEEENSSIEQRMEEESSDENKNISNVSEERDELETEDLQADNESKDSESGGSESSFTEEMESDISDSEDDEMFSVYNSENDFNDSEGSLNIDVQERNVIHDNCDLTYEESHLLILAQALRNNLSDVALESSINLVDCHLPYAVHRSKYNFLKSCPEPNVITYYYCPQCSITINFENINRAECDGCGVQHNKSTLKKDMNYFFYLPLEPQLKRLLNSKHFLNFRKECNESDVIKGKEYRRLVEKNVISENDITIQWNSDGVSVSKSSIKSIWPILVMVNELPYRLRKNNMLLCGLWFGTKPQMNLFLRPFVDELIELHDNGFKSTTFVCKDPVVIKVHTLLSPVDSSARSKILNYMQYNGEFGCPYCLKKGERIPVGAGYARVFCGCIEKLRTLAQHNKDAKKADGKVPVRGVKGYCVVSLIPLFNVVKCFPPEYLHSVLEGVTKLIVSTLFNSANFKEEWYLGKKIKDIDDKLTNTKPPSEITRTPRSLNHLDKWKGSEWKSFLLYYSLRICTGKNI